MSQPISGAELPQLNDLIPYTYYRTLESLKQVMLNSPFVRKRPMAKNTGLYVRNTEMLITNQYAGIVPAGSQIPGVQVQAGWEKDSVIQQRARMFTITDQLNESAKDYANTIGDLLRQFSVMIPNVIDLDLANRFTYAFVSSYVDNAGVTQDTTCGDLFPLAYSAHALTGSPITYSTIVPNNPAFSKGALELALKSAREGTFDNLGILSQIEFNTIGCSPDPNTMDSIDELLHATANIDSANANTFNAFGSSGQWQMRKFVIPRLNVMANGNIDTTKSKMWFISASEYPGIVYSELTAPRMTATPTGTSNGVDLNTLNRMWDVVANYSVSTPSANWIRISAGNGSVAGFSY